MTLLGIVVVLVVVGLLLWLINTYIPMASAIKSLLNIVVFVVVLIWLLQGFGLIGPIKGVHIPNLKWNARRPLEDDSSNASLEDEAGNGSTGRRRPHATWIKALLDRDHAGNGGDARGMFYHAKGRMRSAATDVVPDRHANSWVTSHNDMDRVAIYRWRITQHCWAFAMLVKAKAYACASPLSGMRGYRLREFSDTHEELASLTMNEAVVLQPGQVFSNARARSTDELGDVLMTEKLC
jgi:hypothetical protein